MGLCLFWFLFILRLEGESTAQRASTHRIWNALEDVKDPVAQAQAFAEPSGSFAVAKPKDDETKELGGNRGVHQVGLGTALLNFQSNIEEELINL